MPTNVHELFHKLYICYCGSGIRASFIALAFHANYIFAPADWAEIFGVACDLPSLSPSFFCVEAVHT